MPINILMPALSPTMEKGNLAKWLVKEGDKVASGDVIAEIETDKATMEVEAVDEGTVQRIVVAAGTADVPVNELIAVLQGEDDDEGVSSADPKAQQQAKKASPQAESAGKPPASAGIGHPAATQQRPLPTQSLKRSNGGSGRVFVSPLARRMARENKLELAQLAGSGPHGRIVKRDIEAALKSGVGKAESRPPASPPTAAAAPLQGMSDDAVRKLFEDGSYEVVPHDSMRKIIARRLVEAKTTIPHFYLTCDCRIDKLLALRADMNAAAPTKKSDKGEIAAYKLSVNDMVIKALALALRIVPDANVTWTSDGMLKHSRVDVGVAVSIPGGLITPVVRRADEKTLSTISNEMKSLARRARERKLKPEEYQGGTTAVSNLGMFGVKDFAAVINPPHATILAVGAGEERVIVDAGKIIFANVMSVTLSTDHRAVDGALGAELLAAFKRYIESPAGMLA